MPAPKLRPGRPEHDDPPAGHVLAAVVADALDHRHRAGVAHGEAFADHAPDEGLAAGGPVQDDVPGDDLLLGDEAGRARQRGTHDEPATGQALAEVVVGVAFEAQRDAAGQEGSEALAGRAGEGDVDGPIRQPAAAVAPGDLRPEQRPDGAVDVADRHGELHRARRRPGPGWQASISVRSSALSSPWSWALHAVAGLARARPPARPGWGRGRGRGPSSGRPPR